MKKGTKKVISAVAALAVVLGGFGAYKVLAEEKVASVVLLDINPSIELQVDDDGEVIKAVALNQDAESVLEGMKLRDLDVDTAVNAIVGSLLKQGYVDELANSILITVEDADSVRGAKLKDELTKEINAILSATSINASILAQQMDNTGLVERAEDLEISKGKATLIQSIVDANNTYKAEDLADLSVNELNLILSNPKNEVKDVVTTGKANDSAYIGKDKAKEAAFTHAGVKESDVRELEIDIDYEYGAMVYEVDFASAEFEYDYSVNAKTGEILHTHREYDDDYVASVVEKPAESKPVESKPAENKPAASSNSNNSSSTDIGKDKAKSIALGHAGTTESKTSYLRVEKEYDDGRLEYKVEFRVGNKEYDYEISGSSGKILDYDVDVEDDAKKSSSTNSKKAESKKTESKPAESKPAESKKSESVADIGKDKAKSIALGNAGLSESQVSRLRVERDLDDGRVEYSVEFTANGKEYDYEINGADGKILDVDVDVEDRD